MSTSHVAGDPLLHSMRSSTHRILRCSERLAEEAEAFGDVAMVPDLRRVRSAAWQFLKLLDDHLDGASDPPVLAATMM